MKNFLTSLIFCLGCFLVNAQQDRFIYLQTENHQPFFVKLNNRTLNSNPPGYMIIPKLDDGMYSLVIGFAATAREQEFNCPINQKDIGFIIKNAGENGWQLLNVQTNSIIVPVEVIAKQVVFYDRETDAFSVMLANAVNDTTILRKDVAKTISTEKSTGEINIDSSIVAINKHPQITKPVDTQVADSVNSTVKEILPEKANTQGRGDTAQSVSVNNEIHATNNKTDIAKQASEKANELTGKDTIRITSNPDIAVADPQSVLKKDSVATDVAKKFVTEETDRVNPKDSIKTDVVTVPVTQKPKEIITNDSTQVVAINKEGVKKSKRKKPVKDSTALQDSAAVNNIVKTEPEKKPVITDTIYSNPTEVAKLRSVIRRRSKKNSKEGMEMVYIDDNGDTKDTIRVLIPSNKKVVEEIKITEPVADVVPNEEKKKDPLNDKNHLPNKLSEEEKKIILEANKDAAKPAMINSDCKNFASEDDFLKIRKKMVAENNEEDMVKAARKIFKSRCFTTEQIKNLSVLFLKDDGKYMFFDAAYAFVSDSDNYGSLEKQLTDSYYITRFRAMIHK